MSKINLQLKYHIYIRGSIQTLYSVLWWSTFGSDYSLEASWVWRYRLGTPAFGEFLPLFSVDPLKLCQVGWGALLGHSRTFRDLSRSPYCIVLDVCLGSLSCWVVVLTVNLRLSLRSWALWSRFSSRISLYFSLFIFDSILTSLLVPAPEKHTHSITLRSPCFTIGILPVFL